MYIEACEGILIEKRAINFIFIVTAEVKIVIFLKKKFFNVF